MLSRSVCESLQFDKREPAAGGRTGALGRAAARVIVAQVLGATLLLWDGQRFRDAAVTKRVRSAPDLGSSLVAVGDRVQTEEVGDGTLRVVGIEPRTSFLGRVARGSHDRIQVLAANAAQAIIVSAAAEPPFRPGLVDRFALLALRGGMTPVLCLNKVDLVSREEAARLVGETCLPLDAVFVSASSGAGLDGLRERLAGHASVLVGHSGVGKSYLLKRLFPAEEILTGALSSKSGKGRHTTASARLYVLPEGGHVIDTPGVRMVPLGTVRAAEVAELFPAIHAAPPCRFRPCSHRAEPGCSVRTGVGAGTITEQVYARYRRLLAVVEEEC